MNLFPIVLVLVPLLASALLTIALALVISTKDAGLELLVVLALFIVITGYLTHLLVRMLRGRGSLIAVPEGVNVDLAGHRRLTHLVLFPFYAASAGALLYAVADGWSVRYWVGAACLLGAVSPLRTGLSRLREAQRAAGRGPSRASPGFEIAGLGIVLALLVGKAALWYWILGLARYISLFDLLAIVVLVLSLTFAVFLERLAMVQATRPDRPRLP